ncbi:hypothetical protein J3F83DRAFT_332553 [Trichoderma novae-zelandiae]
MRDMVDMMHWYVLEVMRTNIDCKPVQVHLQGGLHDSPAADLPVQARPRPWPWPRLRLGTLWSAGSVHGHGWSRAELSAKYLPHGTRLCLHLIQFHPIPLATDNKQGLSFLLFAVPEQCVTRFSARPSAHLCLCPSCSLVLFVVVVFFPLCFARHRVRNPQRVRRPIARELCAEPPLRLHDTTPSPGIALALCSTTTTPGLI